MNPILFYDKKDPYYELSNFYNSPIIINGEKYPTTEHYYQAQKFMGPEATIDDVQYAKIIQAADTPNKAYCLARQKKMSGYAVKWCVSKNNGELLNNLIEKSMQDGVKPRKDWNIVKNNVMRTALWAKFTQHLVLKKLLVKTRNATLVENSPRDSYWGIGADRTGLNMLGKILEEIRSFLSGNFPPAPTLTSNWIIPNIVLASAYPGSIVPSEHFADIDKLMKNLTLVVSLNEETEEKTIDSHRKFIATDTKSYRAIISPELEKASDFYSAKVWSERYKQKIIYARMPIKKHQPFHELVNVLTTAISQHTVLIHCINGKSRTWGVADQILRNVYGMSAKESAKVLDRSYESRVDTSAILQPPICKLAIVGSRNFKNYKLACEIIDKTLVGWGLNYKELLHIVSGGAKGADTLARKYAKNRGIPFVEYIPDWDTHGKAAGPIRNKDIISNATHVIAFPSFTGTGTQHSIFLAKQAGLPLKIHYIDSQN